MCTTSVAGFAVSPDEATWVVVCPHERLEPVEQQIHAGLRRSPSVHLDETGLRIAVCHFPPGTSKWNKVEHRLFSFISQNWRGRPLVTHEVVVNLHGRGYRFVRPVTQRAGALEPVLTAEAQSEQAGPPFVGRKSELGQLQEALAAASVPELGEPSTSGAGTASGAAKPAAAPEATQAAAAPAAPAQAAQAAPAPAARSCSPACASRSSRCSRSATVPCTSRPTAGRW